MDVKSTACHAAMLGLLCLIPLSGCTALLTTMRWVSGEDMIPAEYDGLQKQRVAVVCVSDSSSYGTGSESILLSREVGALLRKNVKDIELVRPDEIADWIDREGWDEIDYREIGRGVKAQRVVAIGMEGFRLYEGSSLYRGRANITVSVYDMTDGGNEVFRKHVPELSFPATGPYPAGDISEVQFRRAFLQTISNHVARYFYRYDMAENFGRDPTFIVR